MFGALNDDDNHAEHAVNCAVGMQNAMKSVNEWNASHGYPELEMGVGINSGPAVVGNIGSADKMKYGCISETVNRPSVTFFKVDSKNVAGNGHSCEVVSVSSDEHCAVIESPDNFSAWVKASSSSHTTTKKTASPFSGETVNYFCYATLVPTLCP